MNDWWLDLVEVLESRHHLHDNTSRLPLRYCLVLFKVEVQVMTIAILQYRTERVGVNLEHIVQLHNPRVVQRFVNVVFPQRMSIKA